MDRLPVLWHTGILIAKSFPLVNMNETAVLWCIYLNFLPWGLIDVVPDTPRVMSACKVYVRNESLTLWSDWCVFIH